MILSLVRITPSQDRWQAVEDILLSVAGPTMAEPGCQRCEVFKTTHEESIFLVEEWASDSDLYRHIRSKLYGRVLAAIEFSATPPEISFFDVSDRRGLELIQRLRADS